ncbi:MAG TPA: zf-HC2 domain-containing protein [Candidatus Eisenbacteria bacterium]|nr:zf-HC2 domain-containing protein [Candidatus Eisenbacteria bacterium]
MCDLSQNLVAWLDGELSPNEAATVARHLESCADCRGQRDALRRTTGDLRSYCDFILAANSRPRVSRWAPALAAALLVAAIALLLAHPRKRVSPSLPAAAIPVVASIPSPGPPPVPASMAAAPTHHSSHKALTKRHGPSAVPPATSAASWTSLDTEVEIAIPADAMFAPGVLPQGTRFLAEMRIASDGTIRQVRLRQ